jgi:uncharacterized protein
MTNFLFRAATQSDFRAILALNQQSEDFLSPLDLNKLTHLAQEAAVFQVALPDAVGDHGVRDYDGDRGVIAGFLLGFASTAHYNNQNFLWFKSRYNDFLYVDRVVISEEFREQHLATGFYSLLEREARVQGISRLVCEIHIDPPNPVSLSFHERQGFIEVGQQTIEEESNYGKLVSMRVKALQHPGIAPS